MDENTPHFVAQLVKVSDSADLSSAEVRALALKTIESGNILFLPHASFELTSREQELVLDASVTLPTRKERESRNGRPTVLFDPNSGKILRARIQRPARNEFEAMMARFSQWAETLVTQLLPRYASTLVRSRLTFRPCERATPEGLHLDASYGHPTEGRGMLRVFCNINPTERPRVWHVGETIEPFARHFLPTARFRKTNRVEQWLASLGITKGLRTPYDKLIGDIRDQGKHDKAYQANCPREIVEFPAGSAWIVLTDLVLHGALSGQYSLDQTFFVPVTSMSEPDRSALRILERLSGRQLVS